MAKLFAKIRDLMFGDYDDEYDDEDDGYDVEDDYDVPPLREAAKNTRQEYTSAQRDTMSSKKGGNSQIVSIHTNIQMQVVIIEPKSYDDAQEICDQIKSKKPVVVNLEKVEFPVAQRIMDFLIGTCYSLNGDIQRIANNIFIIAPENVDISGNVKEEIKTKAGILPWVSQAK